MPSTPGNLGIVKVVGTHVTVTWTQPDNDGGAEITGYVIAYCTADDSVVKHITVKGITTTKWNIKCGRRRSYIFAVAAKNAVGTGDFSQFTDFTVPKLTGNSLFSF